MKRAAIAIATASLLAGCANDRIVYRPSDRLDPVLRTSSSNEGGVQSAPIPEAPSGLVGKIGEKDYSRYAIPLYPGAQFEADSDFDSTSKEERNKQVHLGFESVVGVATITTWYKEHIKAVNALASSDLGSLAGTTATGYDVTISVARVDSKSAISITVVDNRDK